MNPTLYDILGVPQDATPDQIKHAWRDAAERFEPGSGGSTAQFRLFNEAAEVLLDPARRREYDAQLAAQRPTEKAPDEKQPPAGKKAPADKPRPEKVPAEKVPAEKVAAEKAPAEPPRSPADDTAAVAVAREPEPGSAAGGAGAPRWLMAALGVLALLLVATAAWLGLNTYDIREVRRHDQVSEAARTAPATAERAAGVILSYDYRSLDSDEKAAERYMTAAYAKQYAQTFDKLVRGNAERLKAHVQATVRASGVSHADPDRANVLLFVDQSTVSTANGGEKQTALNRVEMKMVRQDGAWVVNDITSY